MVLEMWRKCGASNNITYSLYWFISESKSFPINWAQFNSSTIQQFNMVIILVLQCRPINCVILLEIKNISHAFSRQPRWYHFDVVDVLRFKQLFKKENCIIYLFMCDDCSVWLPQHTVCVGWQSTNWLGTKKHRQPIAICCATKHHVHFGLPNEILRVS